MTEHTLLLTTIWLSLGLIGSITALIGIAKINGEIKLFDLVFNIITIAVGPIWLFIVMAIIFHLYKDTVIWRTKP